MKQHPALSFVARFCRNVNWQHSSVRLYQYESIAFMFAHKPKNEPCRTNEMQQMTKFFWTHRPRRSLGKKSSQSKETTRNNRKKKPQHKRNIVFDSIVSNSKQTFSCLKAAWIKCLSGSLQSQQHRMSRQCFAILSCAKKQCEQHNETHISFSWNQLTNNLCTESPRISYIYAS